MEEKKTQKCECCETCHKMGKWQSGPQNAVYGLGFVGALIYFISTASNIGAGLVGIFKAIVWPAYFVYYIFENLGL
ncbi:hypothetical protein JW978_01980 [Candidatus Dojkabacteria bacterium]|nr:hypothetical protein [Candidatus Dojkabacteria bacterium]